MMPPRLAAGEDFAGLTARFDLAEGRGQSAPTKRCNSSTMTKILTTETLVPCPFCGDTPVMRRRKTLHIDCKKCDLVMWGRTPSTLADKWNTNYQTRRK